MHDTASIPEIEPTIIQPGTTVKWTKDLSAHYSPADGWSLTYYFNGPVAFQVAATGSGSIFNLTISAATTGGLTAGKYWWESRVSKSGEVYAVASGTIEVTPNVTQLESGYDGRSDAQKILDAHIKAYEDYAGRIEKQYSLGTANRSFVYENKTDLITAIEHWQGIVANEKAAEKIARGENSGRHILVRFMD